MRRALLAAAIAVGATFAVAAPPASACTGEVCNRLCDAWRSKPLNKVTDPYPCPE